MPGKIFYRERSKVREKDHLPRFNLVAVSGVDLKIHAKHLRKSELEEMAKETDSTLILLKRPQKNMPGDEEVEV